MENKNINNVEQTYYEILEVSPEAPHHEVVKSYERTKLAYAPDSPALYTMFTEDEAQEMRALIDEAFKTLGNPVKRKEYDRILSARQAQGLGRTLDLPDFAPLPEPPANTKDASPHLISREPSLSPSGTLPAGFSRTRLSVYEVNVELEKEIAERAQIDGDFLRKVRTYKNINLEQMCKETRISRSYIAAVEANDYDALPAPVFVRGFVAQLARILGLDENKTANSYMERMRGQSS